MKKGFTLLELIIVVIVIGILVAMALPQFTRMAERGRAAKAEAALDMIRKAEGIYYAVNAVYGTLDQIAAEVPEVATLPTSDLDWAYSVSGTTTFTAIATRRGTGTYALSTITINNLGVLGGSHPVITGTW